MIIKRIFDTGYKYILLYKYGYINIYQGLSEQGYKLWGREINILL